jgi:hypothetical protein
LNDPIIRQAFHLEYLINYHNEPDTLVLDEFGLCHGECRADIVVVNSHMNGYEIKSGADTLKRLKTQIAYYDSIFDHSSIIVEEKHLTDVRDIVPYWWGIILSLQTKNDFEFINIRHAEFNEITSSSAVIQLLWRNEAQDILSKLGLKASQLNNNRSILYDFLVNMLNPAELRNIVRNTLKSREGWRDHERPSLNDDLCLPASSYSNFLA